MQVQPAARRLRILACAGLALYALFLFVSPFEHDDFSCHLKTPQHCTACTSSLVGADPNGPVAPDASHLTDAGKAVSMLLVADGVVLAARSTGRSPPITT